MNRINELRSQMGITMKEAASRLGMPYTTYVNYEKGTREPNSETLIALAEFFGTSIDYLLGKGPSVSSNFQPLPNMTIGERIREMRSNRGFTQDQLAERVGTTKQAIRRRNEMSDVCIEGLAVGL